MKMRVLPAVAGALLAVAALCWFRPAPVDVDRQLARPAVSPRFDRPVEPSPVALPVTSGNARAVQSTEQAEPVKHAEGRADKSLRNPDFPRTYISAIHVDLTSPHHWVELTWAGPEADKMETGPFHSSPGAGLRYNNCDDPDESNRSGSNCTPKGTFPVQGFSDHLPSYPRCQFVTWFNIPRAVAFHSHWQVPRYPASHGCVRLDRHAAQLIHNNSLAETTQVTVGGTWKRWGRY